MAIQSPKRIADLIDRIEFKIDSGLTTPEYLNGVQQQLDSLPRPDKGNTSKYYQYAMELQALVYSARGNTTKLQSSVATAVAQAGSGRKLYSRILKGYVRSHPVAQAAPAIQSADLSMLSKRQQKFMWSHGLEGVPDVTFFVRPTRKLFVLALVSSGSYVPYWMYKNWQAVRDATGRKVSPFWRTIFTIFYIWPLFKTITLLAKSRGSTKKYPANWLAAGYVFIGLVAMPIYLFSTSQLLITAVQMLIACVSATCLVVVQQAARFVVARQSKDKTVTYAKASRVEIIFAVVGILAFVGFLGNRIVRTWTGDPAMHTSAWHQLQVNMAEQQEKLLTIEYEQCAAYIKDNRAHVDTSNKQVVDTFNAYVTQCESTRMQQNKAVDTYNQLVHAK